MHSLHQGSKREDWESLCPSGSEARLQTNEDSEKRPIASEEQDPRAEADRSCVRGSLLGLPRGVCGWNNEDIESQTEWAQRSSETRRSQKWHCSSCSKDKPLHQLGLCYSPKTSRRVLPEEDSGSHLDQEIHPKYEPLQRPSPSHGQELNPKPTPYTFHLAPPLPVCYSYFSLCLVHTVSIIHDYYFYVLYFYWW